MSRQFPRRNQLYDLESPWMEVVSKGPMASISSEISRPSQRATVADDVPWLCAQAAIATAIRITRNDVFMMIASPPIEWLRHDALGLPDKSSASASIRATDKLALATQELLVERALT